MSAIGLMDLRIVQPLARLGKLVAGPLFMDKREPQHIPVMVEEIIDALQLQPGATVVDGTLGLAGHTLRFADKVGPQGTLIGIEWDQEMLDEATERLSGVKSKQELHHNAFQNLATVLHGRTVDGILLDLGLNSAQVDDFSRGFSFQSDDPLDMRMDRSRGEPASAILNRLTPHQIETALLEYGDERWAKAIARKIVERRKERPLRTTGDLNACVLAAIPPARRDARIHPSTRTFQAVRILVNRELEELDVALRDAAWSLKPGGTLAVLSYHSGEDRITKRMFRELAEGGFEELYRKPVTPSEEEVRRNPRSRSAKLRALRRIV